MSVYEFRLPDVGEGLEEAEIIEWLVAPGDEIRRDQPMVEILTDKSQTELPAPTAGTVAAVHHVVGDIAKVGEVLIEIIVDGEAAPPAVSAASAAPPVPSAAPKAAPAASSHTGRSKASPAVRRRAREMGIDLASVRGSGPGGRVTDDDLAAHHPAPARGAVATSPLGPPPTAEVGAIAAGEHPLRGIRRVTAKAMDVAWQIPHIHGMDEVDASNLLSGRARIKQLLGEAGDGITPLSFMITAVARALRRYPVMNASIDMEREVITVHEGVHIGIAVATDDGLLVPVVRDADQRDLVDLAAEVRRLSTAARERSIAAQDLRGGTCTISNYGSLGGRFATPIIRAPEAAIVGFGSIRERPFVVDGVVVARPTIPIATGADHRLIDGDVLTAFQEHIVGLLTDPVALLVR